MYIFLSNCSIIGRNTISVPGIFFSRRLGNCLLLHDQNSVLRATALRGQALGRRVHSQGPQKERLRFFHNHIIVHISQNVLNVLYSIKHIHTWNMFLTTACAINKAIPQVLSGVARRCLAGAPKPQGALGTWPTNYKLNYQKILPPSEYK